MRYHRFAAVALLALAELTFVILIGCAKEEEEQPAVDRALIGTWYQLWGTSGNYSLFRNPIDSSLNRLTISQENMSYNDIVLVAADSGFRAKDGIISDSIPGGRRPRYYYKVIPITGKGKVLCTISAVGGAVPMPAGGVTWENAQDRYCNAADTTVWKQ